LTAEEDFGKCFGVDTIHHQLSSQKKMKSKTEQAKRRSVNSPISSAANTLLVEENIGAALI